MKESKIKHNFLCIGFPKCGTTTLHEILKQHKDIYLPIIKEPIYYGNEKFLNKGFNWYLKRYYPRVIKEKCIGEINPTISVRNNAARIRKDFGKDIKLIFVMRNPIERLYSHFKHWLREESMLIRERKHMSTSRQFDLLIQNSFNISGSQTILTSTLYKKIIEQGKYFNIIQSYLKYFKIENMKFIFFEDLITNPEMVCNDIYKFLGLRKDKNINYNVHVNDGKRVAKNLIALQMHNTFYEVVILNYFLSFPFINKYLTKFLLWLDELVLKLSTEQNEDNTKISLKRRIVLENYYRSDKENLEYMLGLQKGSLWFK